MIFKLSQIGCFKSRGIVVLRLSGNALRHKHANKTLKQGITTRCSAWNCESVVIARWETVGSHRGSAAAARAADWVQGDDTHANAVPPARAHWARKYTPRESRGDPHGWPKKCTPLLPLGELIKQHYLQIFLDLWTRSNCARSFGLRCGCESSHLAEFSRTYVAIVWLMFC